MVKMKKRVNKIFIYFMLFSICSMFSCKEKSKENDNYSLYKGNTVTFWFKKDNSKINFFVFKKYRNNGKFDRFIDSFQIEKNKIHYNKIEDKTTIDVPNIDYTEDIYLTVLYKNKKKRDYKFSKIIVESLDITFENGKVGHISKIKRYVFNNKIINNDSCDFFLPRCAKSE